MLKKILVPIDGSDNSISALKYAINFAKYTDGELKLIYIIDERELEGPLIEDIIASMGLTPYSDIRHKILEIMRERAQAIVSECENICKKSKIACSSKIAQGIINKIICEEAKSLDLVILSSELERVFVHTKIHDMFFGSITQHILHEAGCPVLIVK